MASGSIWQKWDTHIHSFASFRWLGSKNLRECTAKEREEFLDRQVQKLNSADITLFAVVDYWTLDGYLALQEYLAGRPGALTKTVLPGIELRVQAPTQHRLNLQVIFSDELNAQALKDFKSKLLLGSPTRVSLSDEALRQAGRNVNPATAETHGYPQPISEAQYLMLGMETAEITRESLWDALRDLSDQVPDSAVIVLPWDTYHGFEKLDFKNHPLAADDFLHRVHLVETRDHKNRDLFLLVETPANTKFFASFSHAIQGKRKLPVCGSDAHKLDSYGVFPGNKLCWIKAQPTFRGLLQAVVEPNHRSFLGEEPDKLKHTRLNPTKYIESVSVRRRAGASCDEWFDFKVNLNPGLVAIIGNKGSGKSALADILAMLGFAAGDGSYSFLNTDRFLSPRDGLGDKFEATVRWVSGEERSASLNERRLPSAVSRVNYLPQKRLEEICSEIGGRGQETSFEREVKSVIFSHVSPELRGSYSDLADLIQAKSDATQERIKILQAELKNLNSSIEATCQELRPQRRLELEKQLEHKKHELEAHEKLKPEKLEQPDPSKDPELAGRMLRLEQINDEMAKVVALEAEKKDELRRANQTLIELSGFRERVSNIEVEVKLLTERLAVDASRLGLDLSEIVSLKIDFSTLEVQQQKESTRLKELENALDPKSPGSAAFQRLALETESEALKEKLGEKELAYQKSLESYQAWQVRVDEIRGAADRPDTISYYQKVIADLKELPESHAQLVHSRNATLREIYECKRQLSEVYRELFRPVKAFIDNHSLIQRDLPISFEVEILESGFRDAFLAKVNQARIGKLQGRDEGGERLQKILDATDWDDIDQVHRFVNEVEKLLRDEGADSSSPLSVQTTKGFAPTDLLDQLYGLDYLKPHYALQFRGVSLSELSPGERGTILLIFYLLIDKSDVPLIIDQPEDNLDNQTVYQLLVPCIQEARERRQVFMVTHNPNLAVVCDAEQVIVATRQVKPENRISYRAGAIEDPDINKALMDILEGTRPAFQKRDEKYFA